MSRLPISRRLLVVVVVTVAGALAAMIVLFNLLLAHNLSGDADRLARNRAAAELGVLTVRNGRLVVREAPDSAAPDTFVWIFSNNRLIEAPPSSGRVTEAARLLARRAPAFADTLGTSIRLYATPVVISGRRYGTVVGGVFQKPYEQTRDTALILSLALGGALLLLVALTASWLLRSSLRPVARMTRLAGEWSDHNLDDRFAVDGPRDELTDLARTLNGLLDRLAAGLRREQRFSAEMSHELRTPLSRVIAETDLALARPQTTEGYREALELVHRDAQQLSRTIDALVAAARHEASGPRGTADASEVADAAARACAGLAKERRVAVDIKRPNHPIRLGVDAELAERVLQPVVENACRYGHSLVEVSMTRRNGNVVYRISDDGAGVPVDEQEQIFEPGWQGLVGRAHGSGAGLGLALARRLARSVAGDVNTDTIGSGATFTVRLPAA